MEKRVVSFAPLVVLPRNVATDTWFVILQMQGLPLVGHRINHCQLPHLAIDGDADIYLHENLGDHHYKLQKGRICVELLYWIALDCTGLPNKVARECTSILTF